MTTQLFKALVAAQADLKAPKFDKSSTAFGGRAYKYASLAAIIDSVRPALAKHGLAVLQPIATEGDAVVIRTILVHSSGEMLEESQRAKAPEDHQKRGSAITYMRRYGLQSMLSLAADDDDDGAAAVEPEKKPEPSAQELSNQLETIRQRHVMRALEGKDPRPKKDLVRIEGVVSTVYMNDAPKPHRVVLEDGHALKAWQRDAEKIKHLIVGERYVFMCSKSKPKPGYGEELFIDTVEAAIPGEEIPF
jgi:hypothetical protein